MAAPPVNRMHIAVVGSPAVGKSTHIWRLKFGVWVDEIDPTMIDMVDVDIGSQQEGLTTVTIEESGWQEETFSRDGRYQRVDGFLFVVSLTSLASLTELRAYREDIIQARKNKPFQCVIVATKLDLKAAREVSPDDLKTLSEDFACEYVEASSLTAENVFSGLLMLAHRITECRKSQSKCAIL